MELRRRLYNSLPMLIPTAVIAAALIVALILSERVRQDDEMKQHEGLATASVVMVSLAIAATVFASVQGFLFG